MTLSESPNETSAFHTPNQEIQRAKSIVSRPYIFISSTNGSNAI
jgi:hypothetical protein